MQKVYIAGKITGLDGYRKIFQDAQDELEKKGFLVMNPANLNLNWSFNNYWDIMHICYAMIDVCDCVYFLENWKDSNGAKLEYNYAVDNGKFLMFSDGSIDYRITNNGEIIKRNYKSLEEIKKHYDYIDDIMSKPRK
jgi:hypothetical protein